MGCISGFDWISTRYGAAFKKKLPDRKKFPATKNSAVGRGEGGRILLLRARGRVILRPQTKPMAPAPELKLKAGDVAPAFTAPANGGGKVSLADFKGRHVVLYFYPKDDTPGCTKEACAFRDEYAAIQAKGAVVVGVSTDPVKSHDKFVKKFKLPFPLLADEDRRIVEAYGVWGQKSFLGRKYMGTYRVTFLIGPDGRIQQIWPSVKPAEHAAEVLAAI